MFDCPVSESAKIQAAKERFPLAERNWTKGEVNLIHVAGLNVLLHSLDTAADLDVLSARRFARFFQRFLNATGNEMECGPAQHLNWRARMMCEYKGWRVIRRIVTPPAFPLIVGPLSTNWAEHVAPDDESAEIFHRSSGKFVIEAGISTVFSEHLTKGLRREKPLKDFFASHAKRVICTLIGSRAKAIERDTEPGNFYLRHQLLRRRFNELGLRSQMMMWLSSTRRAMQRHIDNNSTR
jgi:hypothetical protein